MVDFRGSKLQGAQFAGAKLAGTRFDGAKLATIDIKMSDLSDAKIQGADFQDTGAVEAKYINEIEKIKWEQHEKRQKSRNTVVAE